MIFNRRIQEFITIDGRDDQSLRESVPSIGDGPIVDGWSGCVHVFCVREYIDLFRSSDLHRAIKIKSYKWINRHVADSWSGGPRVHLIDARDPSRFHWTLYINLKMEF